MQLVAFRVSAISVNSIAKVPELKLNIGAGQYAIRNSGQSRAAARQERVNPLLQ